MTTKSLLNNRVMVNGFWLYILQFFNMIFPMLTLPYITRVLGASQYGVFAFSLNLVTYFQVIVEYGFNLSGSRKIALTDDKEEQAKIFSRISYSKLVLCIFSFIVMLSISLVLDIDEKQFYSILVLYTMVIGAAIQQVWLFQGLQIMQYITIINVISRTLSVMFIFLLVKEPSHIYLYCSLYAVTSLLNGIFSMLIIRYRLGLQIRKTSLGDIIGELKESWSLFTTSAMTMVFSGIGITVLGFSNNTSVTGMYAAIQKVPFIMLMFYAPVGQAIFPYLSKQFSVSFEKGLITIRKILKLVIPLVLLLSLLMILFSDFIVRLLYGTEYAIYSFLIVPLTGWFFFSILNNLLGIQSLIASGFISEYNKAFKIGVITIIISNLLFGVFWGAYGVAFAAMLSEIILTVALVFQLKKIRRVQ